MTIAVVLAVVLIVLAQALVKSRADSFDDVIDITIDTADIRHSTDVTDMPDTPTTTDAIVIYLDAYRRVRRGSSAFRPESSSAS